MEALPSPRGLTSAYAVPRRNEPEDWSLYIRPLVRRWKLALTVFIATVLLVVVATELTLKSYTTTAKLMAGNPTSVGKQDDNALNGSTLPMLNAMLVANGQASAETFAELLQEMPVAEQVIKNLDLGVPPKALLGAVSVKPVTNTSIMSLSVAWKDPQTSAAIANEYARVFVDRERNLVANQAEAALSFINTQLPSAEKRMREADADLARYETKNSIADITTQTEQTLAQVNGIDGKRADVEVQRRQATAQLESVRAQLAAMAPTMTSGVSVAPNPVLAQLETQRAQLAVQLSTAEQQYTDSHPTVISLKQQLAQVNAEIVKQPATIVANQATAPNVVYQQLSEQAATLTAQVESADAQQRELNAQRARLMPALRQLPAQTNKVLDLKRNAKMAEDVVAQLQQKMTQATVAQTSALADVTVVAPASPDEVTVSPSLALNLIVGVVLGLVAALGAAYLLDFFDDSIKEEADVARELGLPVLANIPKLPSGDATDESLDPQARILSMESFIQLVTSLQYASDRTVQTLAMTSPMPGDGKSTIALNTAIALAELQPRVLLVDADMRRSTLHEKLRMLRGMGLSDILAGNATLEGVVRKTPHPGLDVLSSGTRTPNPIALLRSQRCCKLMEEARRTYSMIVFDGTAINPVLDAAVLCGRVDGSVLVVSAGLTELRATRYSLKRLAAMGVTSLLGVVINRAPAKDVNYGSSYMMLEDEELALPGAGAKAE